VRRDVLIRWAARLALARDVCEPFILGVVEVQGGRECLVENMDGLVRRGRRWLAKEAFGRVLDDISAIYYISPILPLLIVNMCFL
jgi:hypothetical protein